MTNNTNNTNTTATNPITSAKFFRFNHFNNTIEGSELNFKKAGNPTSDQFAELMSFKAVEPSFKLAPVAPKVKKQTYAGLNAALITEYVELFGNEAQKAELNQMVDANEAYPAIKSWFLDYFKCGFTVEKAKREIAHRKLNARKAVVRKAVRVKVAPAAVIEMPGADEEDTASVIEMPAAANF